MRLPRALMVLLVAEVFFVHATLNSIFKPFHSLLGMHGRAKAQNESLGIESGDASRVRPKLKTEVDHSTPVGGANISEPKPVGVGKGSQEIRVPLKDFSTTAASVPTKASLPADSPNQTLLTSSLATVATPSSGHSTSVTSTADHATSVSSVPAPTAEAKNFHMADLKIPGGESPDTETLPDVASFEPNKALESADTGKEKESESADTASKTFKAESPPTERELALSPTMIPASTPAAAPPTTTTPEIATAVASLESTPSPRSTTEDGTRESDQFQTIDQPTQSSVFQDVNDLFQTDD